MVNRDEPPVYCGICELPIDGQPSWCQGCDEALCDGCRLGALCLACEEGERETVRV